MPESDSSENDDMLGMLHDAFGVPPPSLMPSVGEDSSNVNTTEGMDEKTKNFFKLLKDVYLDGDKSFTVLLELLKDAFPKGETLPKSFYATRALLRGLGLDYYKVHACPKDCSLYWKETAKRTDCIVCHTPRYKEFEGEECDANKKRHKVPQKIVRYFPSIPRLQSLYRTHETASHMKWHADGRTKDSKMRHPADTPVWKTYDNMYPDFGREPRNVRLGLAADGFNPFKSMNVSHSTWPVILIPYNLPPWLCMKQPYMMLSLLIDGPSSPGNNIDVYLRLVVDELKELWEVGVQTYDAASGQMFQMRAALLWTINDFPALAMLSGWSTKGALACPCCHVYTRSLFLKNGRKFCYLAHRRWLDVDHPFREDIVSFDGTIELDRAPTRLSGKEVLEQIGRKFKNKFGKDNEIKQYQRRKRKRKENEEEEESTRHNWKKRSIFFELEYWEHNMIRHCLDLMHMENNVCNNIVGMISNVNGKGKDTLSARLDMVEMEIRQALHPQKVGDKYYLPPACYTMDKKEITSFCTLLKNIKVPDGYASNIARCVNIKQHSLSGLKSHDNHIIMQQILPIAVRNLLPKKIAKPLIELSNFFRELCSKTLEVDELDRLQSQIALTLCHLEKVFPPAFFDVMEHLPIHLAEEAKLAGPVHYRWMYFIERYLMTLKSYVRSRSYPEGSIAQGYLVEESMTFCSRYLHDVETKLRRPMRNYDVGDNPEILKGRALGKGKGFVLSSTSRAQAHRYMLFNTASIAPYREEHRKYVKMSNRRLRDYDVDRRHNAEFPIWFKSRVEQLLAAGNVELADEVKTLAMKPRDLYELGEQLTGEATSIEGFCTQDLNESDEDVNWVRQDVPGITVDETNLGATDMDED
ncbi:hypothetical protein Vadar_002263 [Vaccinium darrowii]|uniref:Uncharacterized protein n=1 Tax=Vaccinium darrowii TaxID=229202 RepID=A0ACB7YC72_9ERIC|nr:hypothetical protein Vadar_002263 [Vaccinium darrowii]